MKTLPTLTKTWWPVVMASFVVIGMLTTGMLWYTKVMAEDFIEIKMESLYKGLDKRLVEQNKSLQKLYRSHQGVKGRYDEKLKGLDQKLDLILQFQQRR